MRITADSLSDYGLVDEILPEPLGAAHRDPGATAEVIRNALLQSLDNLEKLDPQQLLAERQRRLASVGQFKEA
jgi:acetyl-CoA carboxylase carboxyl transferase subunit alpha